MRKLSRHNTKKYTLKFLLVTLLFVSCQSAGSHSSNEEKKKPASNNLDSNLAQLQRQLDTLNIDSASAITAGAGVCLLKLSFALLKSAGKQYLADDIIVNHPDGQQLYDKIMKLYKLGLQHSTKSSDIAIFKHEISLNQQEWVQKNFAGKTNSEARKYIIHLQEDVAVISGIAHGVDSDKIRKQIADLSKGM